MAFFDKVGQKISQTSQNVAQKTKNMTETMKLNGMVSDEEKHINNAFLQIGKIYYETFGKTPDQLFTELIDGINDSKSKIVVYNDQIKQIKGVVRCPKCGAEVPISSTFCGTCGSPVNTAPAEASVANTIQCPQCGVQMQSDKIFCTNCGYKIEQSTEVVVEAQADEPDKSFAVCPACGQSLPEDASFCLNCGQKITK
jgi:DNA-directed RNA polymerase subunit M/transcription elongation factor TFIIS